MLHEAVTLRLRTLTGQGGGFTGQILTALWGGSEGDRQRYLLVMAGVDSPMQEISEQEIVWAEPAGRTDLCELEATAARSLAATVECAAVQTAPDRLPGPATALIRLPGRGFVRVDVRRSKHTCLPGDDLPSGRSFSPVTDSE